MKMSKIIKTIKALFNKEKSKKGLEHDYKFVTNSGIRGSLPSTKSLNDDIKFYKEMLNRDEDE